MDDLKSVEINTNRGSMLPEGIQTFLVIDGEIRQGAAGPYLNFTCKATGGEDGWEGQRVWVIVSLAPQARWKMDEWLDAHGVPPGQTITAEYFIGKAFRGSVKHETFDGKTRAKIDSFLPPVKNTGKKRSQHRMVLETVSPDDEEMVVEKVKTDKGLPDDIATHTARRF